MTISDLLRTTFLALIALVLAGSVEASQVKQVRVGDHAGYTRIVVELDGPATYRVSQKSAGGVSELVLGLDATTSRRVVSSNSRLVEAVTLRPGVNGAEAHIQLRAGAVTVKEMVLKSPHRIVLDISPTTAATPAAATPAPKPVARAAEPRPTPAPKAVARAAEPRPTPAEVAALTAAAARADAEVAASEKRTVAADQKAAEKAALATAAVAKKASQAKAKATAEAKTTTLARAQVRDTGGATPGNAGLPSVGGEDSDASADGPVPTAAKASLAKAAAEGPKPAPKTASKRESEGASEAEPAAAEPTLVERLGGGDTGLGLSVALGGVALLLAAFLMLRRRSKRIAQEAAAAPWPPPGAEERPEFAAASAAEDSQDSEPEEAQPLTGDNAPLFAATERDGYDDDSEEEPVELPEAAIDIEPEVVAKPDASPQVEELERRVERLEARLADSLDVRERLERQLAAHTEELRVQRAAIARTQRAVRAAVRGPEGGEQPAGQKVPNQVPGPAATESAVGPDEG